MEAFICGATIRRAAYSLTLDPDNIGWHEYNCAGCGARGLRQPGVGEHLPLGVRVKECGALEDVEGICVRLVASQRLQEVVAECGLTGMAFDDLARVYTTGRRRCLHEYVERVRREYRAIVITGSGGSIAQTSGVKVRKQCKVCGWTEWTLPRNGIYVDESQWDGSDFFKGHEYESFLMSQRAAEALAAAQISNCMPRLASEEIYPFDHPGDR